MSVDPRYFMHPNDQKALAALKAIPGFDALSKALMKNFNEKQFRILNLSCRIRLSETQLPEIYELLPPICEKLGIDVPELYLENNPTPNSYTYGDSSPFVVVTSGLLATLDKEDVRAVLAHECGHIACHHTVYTTMGSLLLASVPIPGVSQALRLAFDYWRRCSEFSADRAAAFVLGSAEPMVQALTRLAGGANNLPYKINEKEFLTQAQEYKDYVGSSTWNKTLDALVTAGQSHPLTAVRAMELRDWCSTDEFADLDAHIRYLSGRKTAERICPYCGARTAADSRFCQNCGHPLDPAEPKKPEA